VRKISRVIVIIVFIIAVSFISIYSIFAKKFEVAKRKITGVFTLALLVYLIYLIRNHIRTK